MKVFLILIISFLHSIAFCQEGNWWEKENNGNSTAAKKSDTVIRKPGKVEVVKDKRVDKLIEFKATAIPPATAPQIDGYRVQLFFDQDKTKVNEARAKVLEADATLMTYIEYDAPNYNLLLGNYRTQLEAEKARAALLETFPAAIIVKSRIYFPPIQSEETK
ncbi:MAG: hypothetical protein R3277_11125 [Brumimicrobium sp.]|nr:hypothetical protein [Brumimicrobium sp.]